MISLPVRVVRVWIVAGALVSSALALFAQGAPTDRALLGRRYTEGERLAYHITGTNQDRNSSTTYDARAIGVVERDSGGVLVERYAWFPAAVNDARPAPSLTEPRFRQTVSLALDHVLKVPDLRAVVPSLIGPVTDLLTFYVDLQLAARQRGLSRPGDHAFFKWGHAASWADGVRELIAQDAVDFDVTLAAVDSAQGTARVVVRHVPPAAPGIQIPTAWMREPVADTPNNWIQVSRAAGKYSAEVGKETFDVEITVSLADGRIVSATMDNPVSVLERTCTDAALSACGEPARYTIRRRITMREDK
jgi:hypothetical protein